MGVLRICAALGGTVSGEHGIGVEKMEAMRYVFGENDLRVQRLRQGRVRPGGSVQSGQGIARLGRRRIEGRRV